MGLCMESDPLNRSNKIADTTETLNKVLKRLFTKPAPSRWVYEVQILELALSCGRTSC